MNSPSCESLAGSFRSNVPSPLSIFFFFSSRSFHNIYFLTFNFFIYLLFFPPVLSQKYQKFSQGKKKVKRVSQRKNSKVRIGLSPCSFNYVANNLIIKTWKNHLADFEFISFWKPAWKSVSSRGSKIGNAGRQARTSAAVSFLPFIDPAFSFSP